MKTTDGATLLTTVKEARKVTEGHLTDVVVKFTIDGSTGKTVGHEGEYIDVEFNNIYVKLSGGGNSIKLPNYGHYGTLCSAISNAAEVLLFEYDMEV